MTAFLGNILGKLLKLVYDIVSNIGVEPENFSYYAMSIIITTILFKLLLLPLIFKQGKSTKITQQIQPEMLALQEKYKNDPQNLNVKMQQLYKEHNYNPASGCLLLLVQMPIILAFFRVMREPEVFAFTQPGVYESMNKSFFWIKDLVNPDQYMWGLPLLAGLTTFLQTKTMPTPPAADPQMESTTNMMNMMLPVMIFISARQFPAGLALYWVVSNSFTVIQQVVMNFIAKREVKEVN